MEKKQKIILSVVILIFAILLIFFLLNIFKNAPKNNITKENPVENKTNDIVSKPITISQNQRSEVMSMARGFVEIYGTYTNSDNYANIKELYPFMTDKMKNKFYAIVNDSKVDNNFFSKNTQVLNVSLLNYKPGDINAKATVSVVEKTKDASLNEKINQKTYTLSMVSLDGSWRVDEIK